MTKIEFVRKILHGSKGGIDKLTKCINFVSAGEGNCKATMVVDQSHTNLLGSLHGGFAATLIDNVSSLGVLTHKYSEIPNVSISLSVDFYKAAFIGDELLFDSKVVKVGKNVAFLEVEVFNNVTKELIMKGRHVKHSITSGNAAKILKEAKLS